MLNRLPYVLAAMTVAFLFGWFCHTPSHSTPVLSVIRDSIVAVHDREDTIPLRPIRAPVIKGRALSHRERSALPIDLSGINPPFAIDTVLCEDNQCDSISGFVLPEYQSIFDLQIRHSSIIVILHDTVATVRTETTKAVEEVFTIHGSGAYAALGLERDLTLNADARIRLGNLSLFAGPQLSFAHGPSIWVGLDFKIY